jgi:hypothetical protein
MSDENYFTIGKLECGTGVIRLHFGGVTLCPANRALLTKFDRTNTHDKALSDHFRFKDELEAKAKEEKHSVDLQLQDDHDVNSVRNPIDSGIE